MEELDPIETARRILAGDFLKQEEAVTEDLDEITIEDETDLDLEEKVHGKKMKEFYNDIHTWQQ